MAAVDLSADTLAGFDFDPQTRGLRYGYTGSVSWPIPLDQLPSRAPPQRSPMMKRSTSPLQEQPQQYEHHHSHHQPQPLLLNPEWHMTDASHLGYHLDTTFPQQFTDGYAIPFHTSPTDFMPSHPPIETGLPMDASYLPVASQVDGIPFNWQDFRQGFQNDFTPFQPHNGLPEMNLPSHGLPEQGSPTDNYLEVRSLTSSGSENGWTVVDYSQQSLDSSMHDPQAAGAIFNPGQALHGRTFSDSSWSDLEQQCRSWSSGGLMEVPNAISSPSSDSHGETDFHREHYHNHDRDHIHCHEEQSTRPNYPPIVTTSVSKPINIKKSTSPQRSPTSSGRSSPPTRRQARKNTSTKSLKAPTRRPSQVPKVDSEKRIGRRKGPLRPEQRKQAGEIRKLGACLRCKFLKKTCDPGEPCSGCQPSHARLWVVPCTRIDIKELAYFMKDWRADYERHVSLGFSIGNIKGYADTERTLYITHGYGPVLPVGAREVFVRDERCFGMDWIETKYNPPHEHSVNTAKLSAGYEGIKPALLSDYVDQHIDGRFEEFGFEEFVDDYFEGTPFLTEMLKTVYRYWLREKTPVIRKCLKLLVAYNLTQHVTMVIGIPEEEGFLGKITDPNSKFRGQTVAPVMINFQIKCAMADLWRELQKDILEELSHLYSSVYTRDKLKHWPTIFMTATVLLGVWEEMQFDCQYRIPDREVVDKFCKDMESTPVGVIVGLFSAISQKLPALRDWDSNKHHEALNSNWAVCDALTDVRQHVNRYESYLRGRSTATFDRDDFDSLSSKFVSKLVIRAN